jgi:hypothetical protein
METLRVDADGVQALAGRTLSLAGELVAGTAPTGLEASKWSSAAAVSAVQAAATGAGDALAARTQITAAKIAAADAHFAAQEATSSDELARVGEPVTV